MAGFSLNPTPETFGAGSLIPITFLTTTKPQMSVENAKNAFYDELNEYVPTEQYNLNGMGWRERRTLAQQGGGVQGPNGELLTIAPGSKARDVRRMLKLAERILALKRFLVGSGNTQVPGTTPTATTSSTPSTNKTYLWSINYDKDGDFGWDNVSAKLLQAMYANGKYDVLDLMLDNGKITDTSLDALYRTTLGLTGNKVRFDRNALQAALNGKYITLDLFNELTALLPTNTIELATTPATTAPATTTASTVTTAPAITNDDTYWLALAKKYGFDSMDAVKNWQQEVGITADGKFGELSKAAWDAQKHATSAAPANFLDSINYYSNFGNTVNSYNVADMRRISNNRFIKTPKNGMYFKNTGYIWYDNGRVYDTKLKRKGSYTINPDGSFNNNINWDKKNGGKLMKYFQAGGQINQLQVAGEQLNAQRLAMIELLLGLAAGKPEEAIANFANKMGVDEATADLYTAKILKSWADSLNQAKTDPETKALVGNAITNYQNYKQKYNKPAMAKQGTKLEYFQRLNGKCPEGYEMKMFKVGGKVCKKCQKIEEACKGKKMEDGGESPIVLQFKSGKKCKK